MDKAKVITTEVLSSGTDYTVDNRLRFENGRLYVTRIPYENGTQAGFPEMVDVTEEVLDTFLGILERRREAARENAISSQPRNRRPWRRNSI